MERETIKSIETSFVAKISNFTELEDDYKSITEEYNENKAKIDEELGITSDYIQETSAEPTQQLATTPTTVRRPY